MFVIFLDKTSTSQAQIIARIKKEHNKYILVDYFYRFDATIGSK